MGRRSWQRDWDHAAGFARCLARAASIFFAAAGMLLVHREAAADSVMLRHYQQAQGLVNLSVACLTQDHDGFIWVCTENGLFRYDGVDFERFGKEQGIDSAAIRTVIEDSEGRLWVATSQDLYRGENSSFKPIRPEGRPLRLAAGLQIAVASPGHILVIDGGELLQLTAAADGGWQSRAFFPQTLLAAIPGLGALTSVHVDRLGRIWLGCGSAICRIEEGAVKLFDASLGVPDDGWRSWALDRDGRMWARGQAHLAALEPQAARFEIRDPSHAGMKAGILDVPLSVDRQGRILTSTDGGLSRWQNGWQDYSAMNGIPTTGISAILSDRDGQVWLGVPGRGVERWLGYGHFESWTRTQGVGAPVWSMASGTDRGPLLATRTGCSKLDRAASIAAKCAFGSLPAGEIRVMAQAHGALWVGMTTGGLYRIAAADRDATRIAEVPGMRRLYVDSTDQLWIGTSNGVAVVAAGSMQAQSLPLPTSPGEVADITEDAAGAIWLATQGGLLRWSGGRWTTMLVDGRQAAAGFTTVAAAGDGWVWAGAASHGMMHLHVTGERIDEAHWQTDLMLARAAMHFTRIDRRGWVWAGLVWIGTRAGLTHIETPETLPQTAPLDLRITRLALGSNRLDVRSPPLPWAPDLVLRAHFAQLNGAAAQSILHVRLRGLRDEWFETRGHDVYLPAVGPGRYTLEAFASDADHGQASAVTQFSFEVLPPWWRTFWFKLAAAIACLLLVLLALAWRFVKRREQRRERARREQERQALLERATRDALTGLWNRPAILDILARAIQSSRQSGTPLAVAIIDVDHFKSINDTRGHLAGDEVLRTLGAKLKSRIRTEDALGRYGGEEFLLVVPGATKQRPVLPLERLQRAIAEIPFIYQGSRIKVTASFGVAWLSGRSDSAEELLSRADAALFSAKHAGRNRVEYAATG